MEKEKNVGNVKNVPNARKKIGIIEIILLCSVVLNIILVSTLLIMLIGRKPAVEPQGDPTGDVTGDAFYYSNGIDENGFWEGIKAKEYVEVFDYMSLSIPKDIHEVSDSAVQTETDALLANYSPEKKQVKDRAVVNGDNVNIDYVGSVDGVEFDNGSTGGLGADVVAGATNYIDDFLTQIIGHMPGETFSVEVTFPDVYDNNPDLAGKEAVFVTTINYITERDVTDAFVEENLYIEYGFKTVKEVEDYIREKLSKEAVQAYIREYIRNGAIGTQEIPDTMVKYYEGYLEAYHQYYADMYGMTLESFLQTYVGVSSKAELIELYSVDNLRSALYSLTIQAIAEDVAISVSSEELESYWPGYSSYEEEYGLPWIKQNVLEMKIVEYITKNAVFA